MDRNFPQHLIPKDVQQARAKRHWIPAQPGYYGGVLVGLLLMLFVDVLLVWGTLSLLLLALSAASQTPLFLVWVFYWLVVILLALALPAEAIVAWISFTSARDKLFVTKEAMDKMLALHRGWYAACVAADPLLKNPKLWPPRPY